MGKELLVSIIMPLFNAESFVRDSVLSVFGQSYPFWELLIIDDKSTDNSKALVKTFLRTDNRVRLFEHSKNYGVAKARNTGLRNARGDYVAFLDSDDVWLPNKLKVQITLLEKTGDLITYSGYYIINELSERRKYFKPPKSLSYNSLLKSNFIGNLTGIIRTDLAQKIGFEDHGHEDYIFWLSAIKKAGNVNGIPDLLAEYRQTRSGISGNKLITIRWQWFIYRNFEKIDFCKSFYYLILYAYYGITKYKKLN